MQELFKSVADQMMTGNTVEVEGKPYPVKRTSTQRLRTVKFETAGRAYTAIEQNPEKPSRWGQLARKGHKVVQFKDDLTNKFIAVSVDGEIKQYSR
jgi:hypothetical protein